MDTYFFDEYEQNDINELEKKFINCVENLMSIIETIVSANNWLRKYRTVKYRNWKISVYANWFMFRGRLSNKATIYKFKSDDEDFLHIDKLCFRYYPNNMLLRAVCFAFEIKSAAEFDKFISVLTAAAVSMV